MSDSGIAETLFGSRLRIAAVVVVLVVVGVAAAYLLGVVGAPTVTGVDNAFGGVNDSTTVIESDLRVRNPNPIGVSLGGLTVDYEVKMNDVTMATGQKNGVRIEQGNSTVPFTTYMNNERIPPWWVSHIRNGEHTDLRISADVHSSLLGASFDAPQVQRDVDTNVVGAFNSSETRPLNANREPLISDPVMYLNSTSATWGEVTSERTEIDMQFVVYNPKSYPITVSTIGYDIRMNDVSVGEGATNRSYTIPPQSTRTIEATTIIRNGKLDEWWVSHVEREQVTELRISFYMRFDLSAGGTQVSSVRIPLEDLTQTIETDFFGNKAASGESADDGSGTGGGADGGTATPVGTETATPTPTPTDDGVIDVTTTDTATATDTAAATDTPTPTPTPTDDGTTTTTTDGGGLLSLRG